MPTSEIYILDAGRSLSLEATKVGRGVQCNNFHATSGASLETHFRVAPDSQQGEKANLIKQLQPGRGQGDPVGILGAHSERWVVTLCLSRILISISHLARATRSVRDHARGKELRYPCSVNNEASTGEGEDTTPKRGSSAEKTKAPYWEKRAMIPKAYITRGLVEHNCQGEGVARRTA